MYRNALNVSLHHLPHFHLYPIRSISSFKVNPIATQIIGFRGITYLRAYSTEKYGTTKKFNEWEMSYDKRSNH